MNDIVTMHDGREINFVFGFFFCFFFFVVLFCILRLLKPLIQKYTDSGSTAQEC